jgi:hypothetical protein
MKVLLVVCLAFAGVSCEAEADPYTIGQVLAGVPAAKTAYDGQTRILTHTSYPNGLVQPNGVVYSRAHAAYPVAAAGYAYPTATYAAHPTAAYAAYPTAAYSAYSGYPAYDGVHALGKREAEAEAEAEPWTLGQVAAGLPLLNAAAEGRAPGHIAYTSYNGLRVAGAPALSYAAAPALSYAARPAVSYAAAPAVSYAATPAVTYAAAVPTTVGYSAYSSYPYTAGYTRYAAASYPYHHLGKREAEAEADAYTIGQVAAGLPYANAVATGHAHNPGYLAYTSYPSSALRSSVYGYPAVRSVQYAHAGYPTYANYGAYGAIYG